jgi:FKBP-type peptidyl-prolyl cis-trans isomerase
MKKPARPAAVRRSFRGLPFALLCLAAYGAAAHAQSAAVAPASVAPAGSPPGSPPAPVQAARPTPDEAGYLIGLGLGQQLHQFGVTDEVSLKTVLHGIRDGLAGKKVQAEDQVRLQTMMRSISEAAAAKNAEVAKQFLERNAKMKGVVSTASGLQYKILAAGDANAASPQVGDQVTVQYRGTLLDGTEFDSSAKHGGPATFPVKAVIKGWQEALQLMKPGAKWQLFIPPELAYGPAPRPQIPGSSLLKFDIELIGVKPPPAPRSAVPPAAPAAPTAPPAQPGAGTH